jgi:hypothetical protein
LTTKRPALPAGDRPATRRVADARRSTITCKRIVLMLLPAVVSFAFLVSFRDVSRELAGPTTQSRGLTPEAPALARHANA